MRLVREPGKADESNLGALMFAALVMGAILALALIGWVGGAMGPSTGQ